MTFAMSGKEIDLKQIVCCYSFVIGWCCGDAFVTRYDASVAVTVLLNSYRTI